MSLPLRDDDGFGYLSDTPEDAVITIDAVLAPEASKMDAANAAPVAPANAEVSRPAPERRLSVAPPVEERIEVDYDAIRRPTNPLATDPRTGLARCDAHGLHYDPESSRGCVLCRQQAVAAPAPGEPASGISRTTLIVAGLVLAAIAYWGLTRRTAEPEPEPTPSVDVDVPE